MFVEISNSTYQLIKDTSLNIRKWRSIITGQAAPSPCENPTNKKNEITYLRFFCFFFSFPSNSYSLQDLYDIMKKYLGRAKRIWYLSPMRAAKVQASLRIRAVSPEPSLLAHTSSESRGTFRQKARSLAPLNGWACVVKVCHDGMLEDTNSLGGAHFIMLWLLGNKRCYY